MRRLVYLTAALQDLADILRYITVESGTLSVGQAFAERLQGRCERLATLPGTLGTARPEVRPDIRSTPFQNYVIFSRYGDESVEIVNVLEGHRDVDGHYRGD